MALPAELPSPTSAVTGCSPAADCGDAVTVKRVVTASSSRVNDTAAEGGDTFHPFGVFNRTVVVAGPLAPLITVTRSSRPADDTVPPALLGTTTICGETLTENDGTTFSSMRFSPTRPAPS